jgi:type II secretory pathway component PulM
MSKDVLAAWQSRTPRERLLIGLGAAFVVAVLYVSYVKSASQARTQLDQSVSRLRAEVGRTQRIGDEIVRLRALPPPTQPSRSSDIRAVTQSSIDAAGLASSLRSIEPLDAGQVRVTFGAVPFVDWVTWVDTMQTAHQLRLDATRIEAMTAPGIVSATATFARSGP